MIWQPTVTTAFDMAEVVGIRHIPDQTDFVVYLRGDQMQGPQQVYVQCENAEHATNQAALGVRLLSERDIASRSGE